MRKDIKSLLNTNFSYLWGSQLFSQLTIQIVNFLLLISLFEKTGSTIATSFLWIVLALPAMIVGPFAAVLSDLADRRKILMFVNLIQSVCIFFFSFFYENYLYLTYVVAFIYSLVNQFYVPAEASMLPNVVSKNKLPVANGLFFITQQASIIVGVATAGFLAQILGFEGALRINSFFLLVAFVCVSFLPTSKVSPKSFSFLEHGVEKFFIRIVEGYNYIKDNNHVKLPFALLLGLQVMIGIVVTNLPVLSESIININPRYTGAFLVLPGGIGAVLGTVISSKLMAAKVRKKQIIDASLLLFFIGLTVIAILVPMFTGITKYIVALLSFASLGFAYIGISIPSQTFLQETTPKKMMGRVFGNFWFLTSIVMVIPILFSATVTEILGVGFLIQIIGVVSFLIFVFSKLKGDKYLHAKQ